MGWSWDRCSLQQLIQRPLMQQMLMFNSTSGQSLHCTHFPERSRSPLEPLVRLSRNYLSLSAVLSDQVFKLIHMDKQQHGTFLNFKFQVVRKVIIHLQHLCKHLKKKKSQSHCFDIPNDKIPESATMPKQACGSEDTTCCSAQDIPEADTRAAIQPPSQGRPRQTQRLGRIECSVIMLQFKCQHQRVHRSPCQREPG